MALRNRYDTLARNQETLNHYKEQARLLDGKIQLTDESDKNLYMKWDEVETCYLVHGVEKIGKGKWANILMMYRKYFKKHRNHVSLRTKYLILEKHEDILKEYKSKALKLIDTKKP